MDALHIIPELLNDWGRCDEPRLWLFLENYDAKWGQAGPRLMVIFTQALGEAERRVSEPTSRTMAGEGERSSPSERRAAC